MKILEKRKPNDIMSTEIEIRIWDNLFIIRNEKEKALARRKISVAMRSLFPNMKLDKGEYYTNRGYIIL